MWNVVQEGSLLTYQFSFDPELLYVKQGNLITLEISNQTEKTIICQEMDIQFRVGSDEEDLITTGASVSTSVSREEFSISYDGEGTVSVSSVIPSDPVQFLPGDSFYVSINLSEISDKVGDASLTITEHTASEGEQSLKFRSNIYKLTKVSDVVTGNFWIDQKLIQPGEIVTLHWSDIYAGNLEWDGLGQAIAVESLQTGQQFTRNDLQFFVARRDEKFGELQVTGLKKSTTFYMTATVKRMEELYYRIMERTVTVNSSLLTYRISSVPNRLEVSPPQGGLTNVKLSIKVTNTNQTDVRCEQIKITLPVGSGPKDLYADQTDFLRCYSADWNIEHVGDGVFKCTPENNSTLKATDQIEFEIEVLINRMPGMVKIEFDEKSSFKGDAQVLERSLSESVKKLPATYLLAPESVEWGDDVVLSWSADSNLSLILVAGEQSPVAVESTGSRTVPGVEQDMTFRLRVNDHRGGLIKELSSTVHVLPLIARIERKPNTPTPTVILTYSDKVSSYKLESDSLALTRKPKGNPVNQEGRSVFVDQMVLDSPKDQTYTFTVYRNGKAASSSQLFVPVSGERG